MLLERQEIKPDGVLAEGTVEVNILYITPDDHMPVGAVQEIYRFHSLWRFRKCQRRRKWS